MCCTSFSHLSAKHLDHKRLNEAQRLAGHGHFSDQQIRKELIQRIAHTGRMLGLCVMCVYVCVYVCVYACVYVCAYACVRVCDGVCVYVSVRVCVKKTRKRTGRDASACV